MRPIRPIRRLLNKIYVSRSLSSKPEIFRAQETVASFHTNSHYLTAYRDQEAYFWLPIPGWIEQDFATRPPARCLDIGCSHGTLAVFCKQQFSCQVCCTDFIPEYFNPALGENLGIDFAIHNIELDPLPWPGLFDLIILTEVLEHFNFHPLPTLQKIRNCLAPNGRFYLTTPDAQEWGRDENLYSRLDQIPLPDPARPILDRHIYVYYKEELINLVEYAGFRVIRFSYAPGIQYHHHALTLMTL